MKHGVKYTEGPPIEKYRIVKDFLPPPEEMIFKGEPVKVTIVLSKKSVDFFKKTAQQHHTPYQKLIRTLLDTYVAKYAA